MQQEKHKSMEDTWKTEELKRQLKSESSNEKRHKERRPQREEDRDEHADRRHKSERKERDRHNESDRQTERRARHGYPDKERGERPDNPDGERRERGKYPESDRPADKERDRVREHRREKEKPRDTERPRVSERHRTGEKERMKEKTYRGENSAKDNGTSELTKEERMARDSLEKSKRRSEDRERRHQEKREKEKRKQENEEYKDRDGKHQKQQEDLLGGDREKERRSGDRKHSKDPDSDKRHHTKREKEVRANTEVRFADDSVQTVDRWKEKHSKERHSQKEERRPREKSEHKEREKSEHKEREKSEHKEREKSKHKEREKKTTDNEENQVRHKRSIESNPKQGSDNEKDIEEIIQSSDAPYDDSTNYEEDFDEYDDDDFEEASEESTPLEEQPPIQRNKELEEIQKAMLLENENITPGPAVHQQKVHDQDLEPRELSGSRKAHRGVFIDFGSAKQRQVSSQMANEQKKRSLEILRLIDLDFSSTFSVLELAPVKEYEMYIRNFGKSNTKQAYIQCNDDAVDRDIQTEEIDIEEKWTQHPAEGAVVCGGHKNDSQGNMELKSKVDSQRLTGFLRSAAQVMAVLLEENRSEYQSRSKVHSKEPCMSISEDCFRLNTNLPFLQGRKVYHLQFSEAQRHLLLSVHSRSNKSISAFLSDHYLICVWNIWQPSSPQNVLMCESEVKCCCFSPGKASLVFAGTVDGSVLVWDLREDFSMHQILTIEDVNWTFRSVTFSTDGIFSNVNHTHQVKSIEPVPTAEAKEPGISSLSSQGEEVSGLSFQLASLDENGYLIFWVVVELRKVDLAGSQSDLGLIPGGKVKLVHSSSINLIDKFFHKDVLTLGSPETMNIKFLPQDSNHFVIGTDIGIVTHGTRYGLIEPPVQYSSLHSKLRPSKVTAIDFSPFAMPAFLAGCTDGCIRLHTMSAEYPVMQWNDTTGGQSIIALQWSLTRPAMFFALDAASSIHIWDLLQNDLQPIAKESITSDQVRSMSVFGEPERNNNVMGLALAKASGTVEIQYIKKKWAKPQPKELEKLQLILQEIL